MPLNVLPTASYGWCNFQCGAGVGILKKIIEPIKAQVNQMFLKKSNQDELAREKKVLRGAQVKMKDWLIWFKPCKFGGLLAIFHQNPIKLSELLFQREI